MAFIGFRILHGIFYLTGTQALRSLVWLGGFACVAALMVVLKQVEEIRIYDINQDAAQKYCQELSETYGVRAVAVEPDAGLEPAWPVYKTGALPVELIRH